MLLSRRSSVAQPTYTCGPHMGYKGAAWVSSGHELELGKLSRPHMISVPWVPYRKPMWADHMGPIRDMSRQSGHGVEVGKLCGPHVVLVT